MRFRTNARPKMTDRSDQHAVVLAAPTAFATPQRVSPTMQGALGPVRVDVSVVEILLRVVDNPFEIPRRIIDEFRNRRAFARTIES
jgi:hypothetical protein